MYWLKRVSIGILSLTPPGWFRGAKDFLMLSIERKIVESEGKDKSSIELLITFIDECHPNLFAEGSNLIKAAVIANDGVLAGRVQGLFDAQKESKDNQFEKAAEEVMEKAAESAQCACRAVKGIFVKETIIDKMRRVLNNFAHKIEKEIARAYNEDFIDKTTTKRIELLRKKLEESRYSKDSKDSKNSNVDNEVRKLIKEIREYSSPKEVEDNRSSVLGSTIQFLNAPASPSTIIELGSSALGFGMSVFERFRNSNVPVSPPSQQGRGKD